MVFNNQNAIEVKL